MGRMGPHGPAWAQHGPAWAAGPVGERMVTALEGAAAPDGHFRRFMWPGCILICCAHAAQCLGTSTYIFCVRLAVPANKKTSERKKQPDFAMKQQHLEWLDRRRHRGGMGTRARRWRSRPVHYHLGTPMGVNTRHYPASGTVAVARPTKLTLRLSPRESLSPGPRGR